MRSGNEIGAERPAALSITLERQAECEGEIGGGFVVVSRGESVDEVSPEIQVPAHELETWRIINEIMRKHGATCEPTEFQEAVNLTYHRYEAEVYNRIHLNMRETLPPLFQLLTSDIQLLGTLENDFRVLDVGCGTGLSSELLLGTDLGGLMGSLDLLDTSPEMLEHTAARAWSWGVTARTIEGSIESLAVDEPYDLILACSVLHHIPDLASFASAISARQCANGIFLHIQDPNGDYLNDPELQARVKELDSVTRSRIPKSLKRLAPHRIVARIYRELTGRQKKSYVSLFNGDLLARGIIESPMSIQEIWSVTDIHVHNGRGISIKELRSLLPAYDPISTRSYSFFGEMLSDLPRKYKKEEETLIKWNAMNGSHVAAAWQKVRE